MLDKEWLKTQTSEARIINPNITNAAVEYINELLHTQLAKQQLTTAELKNISITILQKMGVDLLEKGKGK